MTVTASSPGADPFALYAPPRERTMLRWGGSALVIVALHAAAVALALNWLKAPPEPGVTMPAVLVDMSPVSSAPEPTPLDLAPGPTMEQASPSPPEAATPPPVKEMIAPTPPQEKPEVVAPPEQKQPPKPVEPEKPKVEAKHEPKPEPVKPKIVHPEAKRPTRARPAPRTQASPRAERRAPAAAAASPGASAAAVRSYNQLVAAHLQRYKQYPPGAKAAGQQGVASVRFTLGRSGAVLSSRLSRSSGSPALDAEVVAMVRRAQPFPAFPSDIRTASLTFNVPIAFAIR